MKQAVIDIGSNSIRLTLYAVEGRNFNILFREKCMAGLRAMMERGCPERRGRGPGQKRLLEFKRTLELLDIHSCGGDRHRVFAQRDQHGPGGAGIAAGHRLSRDGAQRPGRRPAGLRRGHGGAAPEKRRLCGRGRGQHRGGRLSGRQVVDSASFAVGSLSLYRTCVKKILPGPGSLERIRHTLRREIDEKGLSPKEKRSPLVGVGGTARAVLKLAWQRFDLDGDCRTVTRAQLEELVNLLTQGEREAAG